MAGMQKMLLYCIHYAIFMSEIKKRPPKPKDSEFTGRVIRFIVFLILFAIILFAIAMVMFPGKNEDYYDPSPSVGF